MDMHRRGLLAGFPALGALAPAAAMALRVEAPGAEALDAAEEGAVACPVPAAHDALQTALETLFEGRPLPPVLSPGLATLARCPFCGCGVARGTNHGEADLPRG
jgi:hypothetical protein